MVHGRSPGPHAEHTGPGPHALRGGRRTHAEHTGPGPHALRGGLSPVRRGAYFISPQRTRRTQRMVHGRSPGPHAEHTRPGLHALRGGRRAHAERGRECTALAHPRGAHQPWPPRSAWGPARPRGAHQTWPPRSAWGPARPRGAWARVHGPGAPTRSALRGGQRTLSAHAERGRECNPQLPVRRGSGDPRRAGPPAPPPPPRPCAG